MPNNPEGVVVDLLFASSGIESDIAVLADEVELFEGLRLPVAQVGHLLALKVLSRAPERQQDDLDIAALLQVALPSDIEVARTALALIARRGFSRGRDLLAQLERLLAEHTSSGA